MAEKNEKVFSNTVINWLITIQSRLLLSLYNIRKKSKMGLACLKIKYAKIGENQKK